MSGVIFLGDGVPPYQAVIEELIKGSPQVCPSSCKPAESRFCGSLGSVYLAEGKTETAMEHKPDYLRKSQAERERELAERQGELDKLAAGIQVVEKQA